MPITEMIVAVSIATGIVLIIATLARAASLRSLHRTVTAAIEHNSPEASALIERLGRRPRISVRLIAYVLLAIAAAILGFGVMEGDLGDLRGARGDVPGVRRRGALAVSARGGSRAGSYG